MTDLTKELNRSQGIPFLEYKHFVTRTFFPKVSLCPHQPPQGLLGLSLGCATQDGTDASGKTWLVQCELLKQCKTWSPTHRPCQGRGPTLSPHFPSRLT